MTPEQAREIAAPDSWPWPMSEDARRWVKSVVGGEMASKSARGPSEKDTTVGGDKFNRAEHERFMKRLG